MCLRKQARCQQPVGFPPPSALLLTVDGELELQELADVVVHAPAPHDGPDDGGELVVEDDDVGRVLCNLASSGESGERVRRREERERVHVNGAIPRGGWVRGCVSRRTKEPPSYLAEQGGSGRVNANHRVGGSGSAHQGATKLTKEPRSYLAEQGASGWAPRRSEGPR